MKTIILSWKTQYKIFWSILILLVILGLYTLYRNGVFIGLILYSLGLFVIGIVNSIKTIFEQKNYRNLMECLFVSFLWFTIIIFSTISVLSYYLIAFKSGLSIEELSTLHKLLNWNDFINVFKNMIA